MTHDLFGFDDPAADAPKGDVLLELVCHRESDKAWLLSDTGEPREAKWLPFSLATRGEGPDANTWSVRKWKARELGWL